MKIINLYQEIRKYSSEPINLKEANLSALLNKTKNETPKIAGKGDQLFNKVRYFGLSDDGTLNFKVSSQTVPGRYYYAYIEAPSIIKYSELLDTGDRFTVKDFDDLLKQNDFRVGDSDPSWLYWAFQYMATQEDYEIEPETRAPKRNNTLLQGALSKHLCAVIRNLFENNKMREQIAKDIDNYLRYINGLDHDEFQTEKHKNQIKTQNRAVKWRNNPSDYMNNYFARQAKHHPFLDDKDIKHSLKMEINKYIHKNDQATVDDFLKDYFGMTIDAFSDDMGLPINDIQDYFDELGFTSKVEKQKNKIENIQNNSSDNIEDQNEEGVVAHNLYAPYDMLGRRDGTWTKIKRSVGETLTRLGNDTIDAFVSGFTRGTLGTKNENKIGALVFSVYLTDDNNQILYDANGLPVIHEIAQISGITDDLRDTLSVYDETTDTVSLNPHFYNQVAEIDGQDISSQTQKLMHAKFIKWRPDRSYNTCLVKKSFLESQIM